MRIENGNKYFDFSVLNYQFPNYKKLSSNDPFDVNWLAIQIKYSEDILNEHTYTDSCLLTFELKELIEEFTKVANGISTQYKSDFMEPYFSIEIKNKVSDYTIEISFVTDTCGYEWEKISFRNSLNKKDLLEFINGMIMELAKFPVR